MRLPSFLHGGIFTTICQENCERRCLNPYPLDLIEREAFGVAIVDASGFWVWMVGYGNDFKHSDPLVPSQTALKTALAGQATFESVRFQGDIPIRLGTGLGLSICKWIAEAHRGRIQVESILGQGSCFIILLPLFTSPAT